MGWRNFMQNKFLSYIDRNVVTNKKIYIYIIDNHRIKCVRLCNRQKEDKRVVYNIYTAQWEHRRTREGTPGNFEYQSPSIVSALTGKQRLLSFFEITKLYTQKSFLFSPSNRLFSNIEEEQFVRLII